MHHSRKVENSGQYRIEAPCLISSVVEHFLGTKEVVGPIPTSGSMFEIVVVWLVILATLWYLSHYE